MEGIRSIRLKAGAAGKVQLMVKGKAVSLPALPLAAEPEVTLQLSNSAGQCWQSRFAAAKKNDEKRYTAKQ